MKRAVLHILSDGPGSILGVKFRASINRKGKLEKGINLQIKKKKREEMECSGTIWSS